MLVGVLSAEHEVLPRAVLGVVYCCGRSACRASWAGRAAHAAMACFAMCPAARSKPAQPRTTTVPASQQARSICGHGTLTSGRGRPCHRLCTPREPPAVCFAGRRGVGEGSAAGGAAAGRCTAEGGDRGRGSRAAVAPCGVHHTACAGRSTVAEATHGSRPG